MLKIASASRAPPQTPLGSLRHSPRFLSRERLLAFGNRSFAPLALALSPIFSISVPQKVIYRFTPLLFPTSFPVSIPNTIHHSRLTVCLPDSLHLTRCLSILFRMSACE